MIAIFGAKVGQLHELWFELSVRFNAIIYKSLNSMEVRLHYIGRRAVVEWQSKRDERDESVPKVTDLGLQAHSEVN